MKYLCFNGHERKGNESYCNVCNEPFEILYDKKYNDNIIKNFDYITHFISLGEVQTPVVRENDNLYFKLDYFSPTFSYKDRGSKNLISYLYSNNRVGSVNEDSSGNAGASIAAYGKKAGFSVNIFTPENANESKLKQIKAYGANIIKIKGSRDDVQKAAELYNGFYASHILNAEFRDGIRTLSYEIFKQFDKMPDHIFVPVSAGTLLSGLYSGLKHLYDSNEIDSIPEIIGVQPENISPLCSKINSNSYNPDNNLTSIADALVSKRPVLITKMLQIINKNGKCISVSEDEIIKSREELAMKGIYTEYSSATVYAAYKKSNFDGKSLLILTGNGLKN